MLLSDFEELSLRRGDRIWIQDSEGAGHWGEYLEDFNAEEQTFVFLSNTTRARMEVYIPSVMQIER